MELTKLMVRRKRLMWCIPEAECVISTDVRIGITDCYMETKQETYLSLVHRELSLNQPIFSEREETNKARKSKQLS